MSVDTITTRDLFVSLDGRRFATYREFDEAVTEALGRYRAAFPLTYTPNQAIAWARQNGWLSDDEQGLIVAIS